MSRTARAASVVLLLGLALPWASAPALAAADGDRRADDSAKVEKKADGKADEKAATKADRKARKSPAPGDTKRAQVVKAGWWWLANEPPPETGLLAAPQPPTPTTPKATIPVGAFAGDPEKVSALEVALKAKPGATVKSFTMVLRESAEPGANANAQAAKILACPVTELFWADGNAAAWKDQPTYDCETASAVGKRDDKGLWRFDLTDIAAGWLTEGNTNSHSVVLVEDVEAPEAFQVTFDGPKLEGVGLALKSLPAAPLPAPTTEGPTTSGSSSAGVGGGSGGGGLSSSGGGSLGSIGSPASGGDAPVAAGDPAAPAAQGEQPTEVGIVPVASPPAWYSGIPGTGYLLVPLVLGLAYLVMLSLGPDGRPVPVTGRHGVSRALDRVRQLKGSAR